MAQQSSMGVNPVANLLSTATPLTAHAPFTMSDEGEGTVPLPDYQQSESLLTPVSSDEDDTIMKTLAEVASRKGLNLAEASFLLHVLSVDPTKWFVYPGFERKGTDLEKAKHQADWEIFQAEIKGGEEYGKTHQWSVKKPEADPTQEMFRGMALFIIWARGFAMGKFTEGFKRSVSAIDTFANPEVAPSTYREKFLALYGPSTLYPTTDEREEGDEGTPVGAVAVVLLALGILMYLTRR